MEVGHPILIQNFKCEIEIWEKEKNYRIGTYLAID
jgi:hypothetical protein